MVHGSLQSLTYQHWVLIAGTATAIRQQLKERDPLRDH